MAKAMVFQPRVHMSFNVKDLAPTLHDGMLSLELPVLEFQGPIVTESFLEATKDGGLSGLEVEQAIEDMIQELQVKMIARFLAKRREA